jgi:hypothetical protein
MKKVLYLFLLVVSIKTFGQTAVNFNANDCSGVNHDLFTELNSGKVVVVSFVMPCTSCIGPSLSAYNEVQNYAASHPGRVVFYLSDDVGNTNCTTLTSWANTNGMSGIPVFSTTALKMSDYGSGGMPEIVVLAGPNHDVLFNENNGLDVTNFNNAISSGLTIGISENSKADFSLSVFPNPSITNKSKIRYSLSQSSDVEIEMYNTVGAKVKSIKLEKQSAGKHESILDLETLANGIYYIKLNAADSSQVVKITVAH